MIGTTTQMSHINSSHYGTPPISTPGSPSNATSSTTVIRPIPAMCIKSNHHILVVIGPAGCGKSTVGKNLSERYDFKYIEGDDFHPQGNVQKMAKNIKLTDEDRWDWLILLRDEALRVLKTGSKGVVVTCSALKKKYRDVIRGASLYSGTINANVQFIYLQATEEILLARVGARKGHFMKDSMVFGQLEDLEEPDDDEMNQIKDVQIIDVSGSAEQVAQLVVNAVDRILVVSS